MSGPRASTSASSIARRACIKNFGGRDGDFFAAEGLRPFPVAGFAVAGVDPKDFAEKMAGGYPGVRPSAWDPELRLKDQERDGVFAEVLYPSLGMRLFQLEDGALQRGEFPCVQRLARGLLRG